MSSMKKCVALFSAQVEKTHSCWQKYNFYSVARADIKCAFKNYTKFYKLYKLLYKVFIICAEHYYNPT